MCLKKVTAFFLDRLPESVIPYWDFYFTEGSSEPRDSSALAIALCGMLEMAEYVDDDFTHYLKDAASRLCRRLWQDCAVKDPSVSNGQLYTALMRAKVRIIRVKTAASTNVPLGAIIFMRKLLSGCKKNGIRIGSG